MATLHDKAIIQELMKWKEDHQPVNLEQYNNEIEQADAEIDRGEYFAHKEAVKEIRSWREK